MYPNEESMRYDWNLFSNEYNYWNYKCEHDKDVDREAMLELLEETNGVGTIQLTLMIVCIIYVRIKFSLFYRRLFV